MSKAVRIMNVAAWPFGPSACMSAPGPTPASFTDRPSRQFYTYRGAECLNKNPFCEKPARTERQSAKCGLRTTVRGDRHAFCSPLKDSLQLTPNLHRLRIDVAKALGAATQQ